MKTIEVLFWVSLLIVFYTYLGYGLILFLMIKVKRLFNGTKKEAHPDYYPDVTLLIAAYNEKDYVHKKMENITEIDYPKDKLTVLWITDGSDDGTTELLKQYSNIIVEYQNIRAGKIGAINRGMKLVKTPITVFCDANTMLGKGSIRRIARLFLDSRVGCVAGEKRILLSDKENASAAGEGIYWKYESKLKALDSELYSVVGAAGELFAIRTELFKEVEGDTLLDDFMISMRIAQNGYLIKYDPEAYAAETASLNVKEELKRKIRICTGGIQSIIRLLPLLNIFKYGILSFQYLSHRVLRWTIAPLFLILCLVFNVVIVFKFANSSYVYPFFLLSQGVFYIMAIAGYFLENKKIRIKPFFIPYFFFVMNYAVFRGFFRYMARTQSVNWERAQRA